LDDFKKKFLLDGIDEVGFTLQHQNKIEDFEKNYKKTVPWLFK
jgi:3-isopropylmalate/(R)-2-methylmalate dehydratase small subunit